MNGSHSNPPVITIYGSFGVDACLIASSETPAKDVSLSPTGDKDAAEVQSEKIRYGAPDGPRKNPRQDYDGREPLEFPGHEETASFLAFSEKLRAYKSVAVLSRHFNVTRVTVYRWMKDINVLKRADWISMQNKIAGDLVARREYVTIIERAVELAKEGNIKAMEFCVDRAFPENKQAKKLEISSSSLEEVLERAEIEYERHAEMMMPTWLKSRRREPQTVKSRLM